jgi:hypothetical protein
MVAKLSVTLNRALSMRCLRKGRWQRASGGGQRSPDGREQGGLRPARGDLGLDGPVAWEAPGLASTSMAVGGRGQVAENKRRPMWRQGCDLQGRADTDGRGGQRGQR